ncbi:unnamed protein product [Auanema sp. JU1783]|nr:unnamed protein product [Auanema sp. JU1783]
MPSLSIIESRTVDGCDYHGNRCKIIVLKDDRQKKIYYIHRGTATTSQFLLQLLSFLALPKNFHGNWGINPYYAHLIEKLWDRNKIYKEAHNTTYRNEFTHVFIGHSMGGVLAYLAAIRAVESGIPHERVHLITFGQPRSTTRGFSKHVDEMLSYSFRIVTGADPFPRLPKCIGFPFLGCAKDIDFGYYHHGNMIWLPEKGSKTAKVCDGYPNNEDRSCRRPNIDVDDHVMFYGLQINRFADSCDLSSYKKNCQS